MGKPTQLYVTSLSNHSRRKRKTQVAECIPAVEEHVREFKKNTLLGEGVKQRGELGGGGQLQLTISTSYNLTRAPNIM